jgi:hypothetical protein
MGNNHIVPSYSFHSPNLPVPTEQQHHEGMMYGVIFTMQQENLDFIMDKIEAWFDDRDEIILIDNHISGKQELAFISLEWQGCEIDPLFLAILREEDVILDYYPYERPEVV